MPGETAPPLLGTQAAEAKNRGRAGKFLKKVIGALVALAFFGSLAFDTVVVGGCMAVFTTDGVADNQKISFVVGEILAFFWVGALAFTTLQSSPLSPKYYSTIEKNAIVNSLVNGLEEIEYVGALGLPVITVMTGFALNVFGRYVSAEIAAAKLRDPAQRNMTALPPDLITRGWHGFCDKDDIARNDCCTTNVMLRNTKWLALCLVFAWLKSRRLSGMKIAFNSSMGILVARMRPKTAGDEASSETDGSDSDDDDDDEDTDLLQSDDDASARRAASVAAAGGSLFGGAVAAALAGGGGDDAADRGAGVAGGGGAGGGAKQKSRQLRSMAKGQGQGGEEEEEEDNEDDDVDDSTDGDFVPGHRNRPKRAGGAPGAKRPQPRRPKRAAAAAPKRD